MKKLLLTLLALLLCVTALCVCIAATEGEGTETTDPGLTGNETGLKADDKYPFAWEYDPDTYTLKILSNSTNKRILTQGQDSSNHRAFNTWRKTYTDYADAVQVILVDDALTSIKYEHGVSALANWKNVHTIYLGGLTSVLNNRGGGGLLQNNPKLTTVYGINQEKVDGVVNLSNLKFSTAEVYNGNYKDNYNMRRMLYNSTSVTNVVLPYASASANISREMFRGCSSLVSIEIPDYVNHVGYNAFYGCKALTSMTLSSNVSTIESNAFTGCTGLTSIVIENPALGVSGLTIPDNEGLVITCASKAQQEAIVAKGLTNVTAEFKMPPANLMADGSGYQYAYENGIVTIAKADTTASTVLKTDIALDFIADVTTVIIPEDTGITEISANMFENWGASTVVIPSTLKTIGAKAFANMPKLSTVVDYTAYTADNTAGAGVINLLTATSIAMDAFSGSSSALEVDVYFGKSAAFTGETFDFFAADAVKTLCVYPTSKIATYFRSSGIKFEYLTVEQTGDEYLAREM